MKLKKNNNNNDDDDKLINFYGHCHNYYNYYHYHHLPCNTTPWFFFIRIGILFFICCLTLIKWTLDGKLFFPILLLMLLFNVEFTFLRFVIVTNIFKASVSFSSYFILLVCCINIAEKLNNIKTIYWKNQRTTRKKRTSTIIESSLIDDTQ